MDQVKEHLGVSTNSDGQRIMYMSFLTYKNKRYVSLDDIKYLLLEFGASEETIVRDRIKELINNLSKYGN